MGRGVNIKGENLIVECKDGLIKHPITSNACSKLAHLPFSTFPLYTRWTTTQSNADDEQMGHKSSPIIKHLEKSSKGYADLLGRRKFADFGLSSNDSEKVGVGTRQKMEKGPFKLMTERNRKKRWMKMVTLVVSDCADKKGSGSENTAILERKTHQGERFLGEDYKQAKVRHLFTIDGIHVLSYMRPDSPNRATSIESTRIFIVFCSSDMLRHWNLVFDILGGYELVYHDIMSQGEKNAEGFASKPRIAYFQRDFLLGLTSSGSPRSIGNSSYHSHGYTIL
ncbi:hypothetical protein SASPL_127826 [Salvia splendens]|uniref:Uncharacterized protein n=1 Tax=Salvia splendens TaxID=180675 RepID=A0A8X8ZMX2_SALSN|nr:hypothetical protein SASPL_127826 [Salvia splendens]